MRDAALARPHEGCSTASVVWSSGGGVYVTVVVKATLALRDGGPAALVTAAPVEARDRFIGREHASSLLVARELFPYRPRVDVTATGHAHLPSSGVGVVRLAVAGDGGWIDKTLEVRPPPSRGRTRPPAPRVPLSWEGTWADDENPLGVRASLGGQAWIVDPARRGAPAGLGPLPPSSPRRVAALRGADARLFDEDAPRVPEGFDWEHFQAAPGDQQLAWLAGHESVELYGMIEGQPAVRTRLPGLAAAAWAFAPWEVPEGQPIDLVADGVVIDADRALAHVVWRATYPLLDEDWSLSQLQILASVTAAEVAAEEPAPPAAPRTLAGLGPGAGAPDPAAASLFDTDDGDDHGTRPLTRKELLAAMADAGKALPFGAPPASATISARTRTDDDPAPTSGARRSAPPTPPPAALRSTAATPPAAPSPPSAPSEETRPLSLARVLAAVADEHTLTGDEASIEPVLDALPPWLRTGPPSRRDTEVDPAEHAFGDEETHVEGDVPGSRRG
jgi:hypothetical protein